MPKNNTLVYLFFIFLIGILLRFYNLTGLPPSLNWDEVSHAYNSYSLLHTGTDQWGRFFPIFNFRAYGDYPAALNIILTVLPLALFGPTDFAVRFPHALIGSLTVLAAFAAAYYWRKNSKIALLAALLVCIDPWTLFPSRAVFQSNWVVLFLTLGLALYFKKDYFKAFLFWGISLYAYHNARIFIPLLVLPILFHQIRNKRVVILTFALYIPVMIALLSPTARARGTWVGILDAGAVASIEQARNNSTLPPVVNRLVNNRISYFVSQSTLHYIQYFSPQFLFFKGGTQYQFSLPGYGVLPWINLPFFYLGIILLLYKRQRFLGYWLLLAPIPAAITRDSYAVIRATTMLPVVQLITAWGVFSFYRYLHRPKVFLVVYFIFLYAFLEQYLVNYLTIYPVKYSQSWQYGYKQAVMQSGARYDKIIFTKKYGEPHEYVLWYRRMLRPEISWDYHADWYWVNTLNNYVFINDWDMYKYIASLTPGKYLLIGSPANHLPGALINQINYLDGSPAYIIKVYEK